MLFLLRRVTVSDSVSCWCCSRLPPQHCRDSISTKRVDPLSLRTWPQIYQVCHDRPRVLVPELLSGRTMISRMYIFERTCDWRTFVIDCCRNLHVQPGVLWTSYYYSWFISQKTSKIFIIGTEWVVSANLSGKLNVLFRRFWKMQSIFHVTVTNLQNETEFI